MTPAEVYETIEHMVVFTAIVLAGLVLAHMLVNWTVRQLKLRAAPAIERRKRRVDLGMKRQLSLALTLNVDTQCVYDELFRERGRQHGHS